MHSSLVITTAGLPLGLCAVKFWTRDKFKGTAALKRKINPTRVPIEKKESIRWLENLKQSTELLDDPGRCIHIGDRESDIYELFCTAQEVGTHFLVRTCVDRLAGDGDHTVADEMDVTSVKGLHRIEVRDDKGDLEEAILEIRYRRIRILRPWQAEATPSSYFDTIDAEEQKTPKNRKKSIGSSHRPAGRMAQRRDRRGSTGTRCADLDVDKTSNQAARWRKSTVVDRSNYRRTDPPVPSDSESAHLSDDDAQPMNADGATRPPAPTETENRTADRP